MGNLFSMVVTGLNLFPGYKTRAAAVAALALAVISAWNAAAPGLGLENAVLVVPEWVNAATLALLGVGAANQPANNAPKT